MVQEAQDNMDQWPNTNQWPEDTQVLPLKVDNGDNEVTASQITDQVASQIVGNQVTELYADDEECYILKKLDHSHTWLGTAYRYTLFLDWVLIGLTHQYGFKPVFFHRYDGDVYFVVLAIFAVATSLALRDTQLSSMSSMSSMSSRLRSHK
jgi:biopolymer transport protein ExbD